MAPALPDLDAIEAERRILRPYLPKPDPAFPAGMNEFLACGIALEALDTRETVDALFASLSPLVQAEIDSQHTNDSPEKTTDHRRQFFARMRLYFPSWQAILDHFSNFERVRRPATTVSSEVDIVLHHDAAVRLERVLNVLANHNHPFPRIMGGFQLRHFEEGKIQSFGMMIHALGYAIDISANENPRLGFDYPGVRGLVPYLLGASIGAEKAHMEMGKDGQRVVEAMGKRTVGDDQTLAADDQDPVAKKYFQLFEQQFRQLRQGSLDLVDTISATRRTTLLDVRKRYFDVLREIQRNKRVGDPAVMADLQARRRAILAEIPPLVTEWIGIFDAHIRKSLAAHPGMDKLRPPVDIQVDLLRAETDLQQARQDEQRAKAETAAATRRRDAAIKQVRPAGQDWSPVDTRGLAAREKEARDALVREVDAERRRRRATAARDRLKAELATSDTPALRLAWDWIAKVRELSDELVNPDLSTPAGLSRFEALTTGDPGTELADNPPLLRLLEVGFFNPKGAFDLEFFEEMAHSGFVPGSTWSFGWVDSMHFELQEGKNRIIHPGTP